MIVTFGTRSCKTRGVLIESISINGENPVYFFKYANQKLTSHCIEIQNIMRAADIKTAKKVQVDISDFMHEYYNPVHETVWFKGIKLDSNNMQLDRTMNKRLNIDVGIEKRKQTIIDNKATKAAEKQRKLDAKNTEVERLFQEERARRIHELKRNREDRMDST